MGMAGTLAGHPFPTMQGIFSKRPLTSEEQADLLAFFKRADKQSGAPVIPSKFTGSYRNSLAFKQRH
jgi:hypothetical protein